MPKIWIIINNFGQLRTQEFKATKNQVVRINLNEKKWKGSHSWLMSLYWKRKLTWRKDLVTYNSYSRIMFSFKGLVKIWRGEVCLKLDVQGQEGERILDIGGQRGWRSWNLDNFYGCHMWIVPYFTQCFRRVLSTPWAFSRFAAKIYQICLKGSLFANICIWKNFQALWNLPTSKLFVRLKNSK